MSFPNLSLAQSNRFQKLGINLNPWSEEQINFWKRIYTEFSTEDYVIHDSMNLDKVYAVASSEKSASEKKSELRKSLPAPEAERLRTQLGQKDRIDEAKSISIHFFARMEEMLEEEGVPKVLARLPFVESGFNQNAKSSVGAIGIWQFMPKTAIRDLRVDSAIDERYDPLKSTRAAAKFLKRNEALLKNWGLAIMAYHQGPGLVLKAVKQCNTSDPIQIIRFFKDSNFQFASRNYLFEFLAMTEVQIQHEEQKLPNFITVSFPKKLSLLSLLKHYHLSEKDARLLNPHFRAPIWAGKAFIPAHYPVRLGGITLEEFHHLQYPAD